MLGRFIVRITVVNFYDTSQALREQILTTSQGQVSQRFEYGAYHLISMDDTIFLNEALQFLSEQ